MDVLKTSLAMPYMVRLFEIFLQIAIKVIYFRARLERECELALSNSIWFFFLQYVHSAGVIHRVSGVVDQIIAVCCKINDHGKQLIKT